jgi:hypothetical protein
MDARREHLHRRAWELLPWHANGTLGEAERQMVEEHLAACDDCRRELAACRDLAREMGDQGEVAPSPHPVQFARLMARIDAGEALREARQEGEPGAAPRRAGRRVLALWTATPRPVRTLLAAQLGAIALLGALLTLFGPAHRQAAGRSAPAGAPALYSTLSDPPPATAAPGRQLRVVFDDGATAAAIHEILTGVGGQIVAGPSTLGTYTVEVPAGRGADPLKVVLTHLKARREVSFAEPVAGAELDR